MLVRLWYRFAPLSATRWYVREHKRRDRQGKPADPVVFGEGSEQ